MDDSIAGFSTTAVLCQGNLEAASGLITCSHCYLCIQWSTKLSIPPASISTLTGLLLDLKVASDVLNACQTKFYFGTI